MLRHRSLVLASVLVTACTGPTIVTPPEVILPPLPTPTQTITAPPVPSISPAPPPTSAGPTPITLGTFDIDLAPEGSGIVASRRDPDVLWFIDDGPGTTSIVAVRHDGTLVTRLQMEGVEGRDTEDIAAGPCGPGDPSPCLYVGDIGDNRAVRERVLVHRFPEPDLGTAPTATQTPVTTASFTIPGGPVDAEALLVTAGGLPVILTKDLGVARVLVATGFADGELVQTGTLTIPAPARPLLTTYVGLSITAADSSPDGSRVLLRTYDTVLELTAPSPVADLADLATWTPTALPVAPEGQGEAIAYLPDGRSYVTAGEGSGVISVVRR